MATPGQAKSMYANQRPKKMPTRYEIFYGKPPKMTGLNTHVVLDSSSFASPSAIASKQKRGVCVIYVEKGPISKRRQPPLKPDEKEVLRNKIIKFIERKYIAPPAVTSAR
jgi:hypothetical protein